MLSNKGEQIRLGIVSGARWTTLGQIGSRAVRFLVSLVLARLLAPGDFGVMAMAFVAIGFADLFKDLGTVPAVVGIRKLVPELIDSVFALNTIAGLAAYGILYSLAPAIANMYGHSEVEAILRALAITLIISSLGLVKRALLQRNLRFGLLAGIDLVAGLIQGTISVGLALAGFSVWSLVAGHIAGSVCMTVLLWVAYDWRPRILIHWRHVKTIAGFSLSMTGSQVASYFINQVDKLLIGVVLGDAALGLYSLAQRLMETAISFATAPVMKVLYPAFSRIRDENDQISLLYTRACATIAVIVLPVLTCLALLARPFCEVVLGPKWAPAAPVMTLLAIPAMIQCVASTVGALYMVKSKAHWLLVWQIGAGVIMTCAYLVGLRWGIVGVAAAYGASTIVIAYPAFVIPFKLIDLKIKTFSNALLPYGVASLIMGIALLGMRQVIDTWGGSDLMVLVGGSVTGVLAYGGALVAIRPSGLGDLGEFLMGSRFAGRRKDATEARETEKDPKELAVRGEL